jgi:hypothetical protein
VRGREGGYCVYSAADVGLVSVGSPASVFRLEKSARRNRHARSNRTAQGWTGNVQLNFLYSLFRATRSLEH